MNRRILPPNYSINCLVSEFKRISNHGCILHNHYVNILSLDWFRIKVFNLMFISMTVVQCSTKSDVKLLFLTKIFGAINYRLLNS